MSSSIMGVKAKEAGFEMLPVTQHKPQLCSTRRRHVALKITLFIGLAALVALHFFNIFGRLFQEPWPTRRDLPDLYEASVTELQHGLDRGHFTSVVLVQAYLARIEEVNLKGPELRAVLEINPSALSQAIILDRERHEKGRRSNLHGIPVLVKDNIATLASEGMNTTAGSFALLGSVVSDDAGVIKRLRKAGAIILGKLNLSEFSQARGDLALGWSGRGGQTTNAYFKNGDPCGSSSGSGVAASIGLAAVTLGTETDGSITCPSSFNNVVGIKPTLGLTSRAGVIPISEHQDTVGPITRSVRDAAIVLNSIAGKDLNDKATLMQPPKLPDFTHALRKDAFKGKRIGVPRRHFINPEGELKQYPIVFQAFEEAIVTMRNLGATIIDPADMPAAYELTHGNTTGEGTVLRVDFKVQMNDWLQGLTKKPEGVNTLADIIAFNNAHRELEKPVGYESQSILYASEATTGRNSSFIQSLELNHELGRSKGIDAALQKDNLDALILPSVFDVSVTTPSALAGYPIVTGFFPMDTEPAPTGPKTFYPAPGLPFGLQFLGAAYTEYDLIGLAYAYEQKTQTRHQRKAIPEAIPKTQLKDVMKRRKPLVVRVH